MLILACGALDLVGALIATDELAESLFLQIRMGEVIDGEIGGGDYTAHLTFALRAFFEMLATELLVNLEFLLALFAGFTGMFVDVNRHCIFILPPV